MRAIEPLWGQSMPLQFGSAVVPAWARARERVSFQELFDAARARDPVANSPVSGLFRSAAEAVRETDARRVETEYQLATGQIDNPSVAMIEATKAQLSVTLLVQMRNRALEAYNELIRMNL